MTQKDPSYWDRRQKAERVTRGPRCFKCHTPTWGLCYGPMGGGKLYACPEHQAEAAIYFASKFPEDGGRLLAIERGELLPLPPAPETLDAQPGGPLEGLRRPKKAKAPPPPDTSQGSLL